MATPIMLVTLQEAKDHLRIDEDDGDPDLTLKIQGASAALLSYIQGSRDLIVNSAGELIEETNELSRMKSALLVLLGYMDRNRGGEEGEKLSQGNLPFAVTMLIYDLRQPSVV
ncbi:head-tail connector protein [Rouxiella badensis]|uniref:head-tail connector protein n=1 Tax=Rouxiella badensis TaxID=1646377 RepID=UPI003C501E6D